MRNIIAKWISKTLREIADKIDSGNCELDEEQAMHIMSTIGHEVMSKDSACSYLNISRSKLDSLVADGKLPKGKKRRGFKELVWFKDELSDVLNKSL
jgi:predicted DNA-binding transcriptional regulator AlpA